MTYCLSLLCPAFATTSKSKSPDFVELCNANMGINVDENVEFFQLVKFDPKQKINTGNDDFVEVAVRVKNSQFSMKSIEGMIQQNEKLQDQIEKMKEAISSYSTSMGDSMMTSDNSNNELKAKVDKYKSKCSHLETDNKKLKKMFNSQVEKSEGLRKECHITVEKLREEFDSLVKEFMEYKKADGTRTRDNKKSSKSYVPDLGVHKPVEIEKNLGPILAEGGHYNGKRGDYHRDNDAKRANREQYEDTEDMEVDYRTKGNVDDQNPANITPFVPLLSLGKIGEK